MPGNPRCTVYVGNLDEKVSDRVLYDILIQAGRVVDLHIPRDKETNRPKGFAFAEYETAEIADYAVGLFSGLVTLYNRTLKFAISGQDKPSAILPTATTPASSSSARMGPPIPFDNMEVSPLPARLSTPNWFPELQINNGPDSSSLGNVVPSGESISHNGRDYTPEFTTDQIFESREEMLAWARRVGLENGIVVVIKNSANLKGGKLPKCILGCERGGKYKPHRYLVGGQTLQRNTGTKKCDCPFELRGKPLPPDGVMWGLRVSCGFHNHKPAENFEGHEYPSRLKPMEKQFVVDMANSTTPREILSILKQKDPSNTTGIRSIYNAIFINKEAKRTKRAEVVSVAPSEPGAEFGGNID